jgi:hypothetical protein
MDGWIDGCMYKGGFFLSLPYPFFFFNQSIKQSKQASKQNPDPHTYSPLHSYISDPPLSPLIITQHSLTHIYLHFTSNSLKKNRKRI